MGMTAKISSHHTLSLRTIQNFEMNSIFLLDDVSSLSSVKSESANNILQANYTFPMATGGLAIAITRDATSQFQWA